MHIIFLLLCRLLYLLGLNEKSPPENRPSLRRFDKRRTRPGFLREISVHLRYRHVPTSSHTICSVTCNSSNSSTIPAAQSATAGTMGTSFRRTNPRRHRPPRRRSPATT
uniref:(northern house mosquito) hypothetical protein n=1 Tax=Culex pipiens TaxID=7175 RepID=A0A8D8CRR7_CULPI